MGLRDLWVSFQHPCIILYKKRDVVACHLSSERGDEGDRVLRIHRGIVEIGEDCSSLFCSFGAGCFGRESELQKLFKQFVLGGVLTEAEFWATRKKLLDGDISRVTRQRAGFKSVMLADVRPSANGRSINT
ncbi:hypothetical protein Vadar_026432 [Vaccinium darrowii]|uniref:Uncharacterized protein n=1 Tax=Vaccinium darrowii TaxID=229202 RepID=A0ACB7YIB1_9ERIC|nr:hypothetical protein Vadar_026432 [Vaccinium darrowii]